MKHRLLLPLMICALALAGCYRQAEEEFQSVDSSEVDPVDAPITVVTTDPSLITPVVGDAADTQYITPEPPPGQVEQPTLEQPTGVVVIAVTPDVVTTRNFELPTATTPFEDTLNPESNCVYTVVSGDTLFRLALAYGTTVEEFQQANGMEGDALQIGQLLLVPGCATPPPPTATAAPTSTEPPPPPVDMPEGQAIHVVSAGETLNSIALRYGVSVQAILDSNSLENADRINVGQELLIITATQPAVADEVLASDAENEPAPADDATPEAEATAES